MPEEQYTENDLQGKEVLHKLSDTDFELADPNMDLRGRKVIDQDGETVGHVENLYVDQREVRVRFLEVTSGGFLGLGSHHFVVPVDAINRITTGEVRLGHPGAHIAAAPKYDPTLSVDSHRDHWEGYYDHYGYSPYWYGGYVYPMYPYS